MTISNEVWVATALLHREQPSRPGFRPREIARQVAELHPETPNRKGVAIHIGSHCVANQKASPARLRMLWRNPDRTLRLYRPGDPHHPERKNGRMVPERADLSPEHRELLDWYWSEYAEQVAAAAEDPIAALRGVGKELWRELGGEAFITGLRADWFGRPEARARERRKRPA